MSSVYQDRGVKSLRVILLDDEIASIEELEYQLKRYKNIEIAATYTDPVAALEEMKNIRFDVAFLDIDMPIVNGLNVARELLEFNHRLKIIFITAYEKYAVKAFEINALDYIIKPVVKERLDKTVEKLADAAETGRNTKRVILDKLNRIEKNIRQDSDRIPAQYEDEISFIKICQILYIEAEKGRSSIVTINGRFRTRDTLDCLQEKLEDYAFFRCHRSYIVNLRYVNKVAPVFNNSYILKQDGVALDIPVSRTQIKELKRVLGISRQAQG